MIRKSTLDLGVGAAFGIIVGCFEGRPVLGILGFLVGKFDVGRTDFGLRLLRNLLGAKVSQGGNVGDIVGLSDSSLILY